MKIKISIGSQLAQLHIFRSYKLLVMYHKQVVNFLFLQSLNEKKEKKKKRKMYGYHSQRMCKCVNCAVRERQKERVCRSGRGGGEEERKGLVHGSDQLWLIHLLFSQLREGLYFSCFLGFLQFHISHFQNSFPAFSLSKSNLCCCQLS